MSQQNVLLISDDGEFARAVMSRWQSERVVPAFTVFSTELLASASPAACDLVILGPVQSERLDATLDRLRETPIAVIAVAPDVQIAHRCHLRAPRFTVLRQFEGWTEPLVLLSAECLRRLELARRLEQADKEAGEHAANATLGRYMLDMRHSLNNALTSVLGNAELLLMEPGVFTQEVRDQLQTIHTMSLRMHEILMRFSSLEIELGLARREARQSAPEGLRKAAGWTSF